MEGSENLPVDQADKLRERNRLFWKNIFNPVAYEKLVEDAEKLEKQVNSCSPENRFDEIVLDNMQHFAESSKDLAGFLTKKKSITTIEAVNSVYGDGTFQRIKKELKEYDWKENYKYKQLEMERNKVDPRRYKKKLKNGLDQVSSAVEEFGRKKGLVPEELSMNVVPIPSSRKQRAFYNAEQKEVNIGLDYFNVVKQSNELTICSVEVVYAIFHEFIGHATHQHNSMKLRHPRFTDRPIEDMMANAHAEAVGIKSNQYAKKFLEEKKRELPVTDIGIKIKNSKIKARGKSGKIAAILFNEMERRGEIQSAQQKLEPLVSKEWASESARNWDTDVRNAIKETSYTAGEKLMEEINTENYQALTTGLWNPNTLPKYLKYRNKN